MNKYIVMLENGEYHTVDALSAADAATQATIKWGMRVTELKPAVDETKKENKTLLFD